MVCNIQVDLHNMLFRHHLLQMPWKNNGVYRWKIFPRVKRNEQYPEIVGNISSSTKYFELI